MTHNSTAAALSAAPSRPLGIAQVAAVLHAAGLPHGLGGAQRVGWHAFRGAIVRHHAPVAVRWFSDAPSPHSLADCVDALRAAGYGVEIHPTMGDVAVVEPAA